MRLALTLPVLALALATLLGGPARADTAYALVIGVNQPLGKGTSTLSYADDDAILFHRLFAGVGHSTLLVAPDRATTRLHGAIPGVRPPTRANLERAIDDVLKRVKRARKSGWRPHLYVVYSGHGDVKNNQGYLALADGRFTSRDLARLVLSRSRALTNHVIVDACRSYYLVHGKRAGGKRRHAGRGFHRSRNLARRFPNTGFLLSTSSAANSHEWAEFQAGIFSHEVRSGLLGGADVDLDGRVSYDEIWAFIRVANSRIPNERFRPRIYLKAPYRSGKRPILDLRGFTGAAVTIPPKRAGRYLLEDRNGVRLADLHTSSSRAVRLRLTDGRILGRSKDRLYLHDVLRSKEYLLNTGWKRRRQLAMLPGLPSSYKPKGAAHEAFGRIFEQPFSLDAYQIELQCTAPRQRASTCPSYYCDRCRCKGCQRVGGPPSLPPAARPAPPTTSVVTSHGLLPHQRRPWETIIEAAVGFRGIQRTFEIDDSGPRTYTRYEGAVAPALALALELYPMASWRGTPLADIGLSFRWFSSIGLESRQKSSYGEAYLPTTLDQFDLGLLFRWFWWDEPTSPSLKFGLEGGVLNFNMDDPVGFTDLPDVSYVYMRYRVLQLDLPLVRRGRFAFGLLGAFNYLHIFSSGDLEVLSLGGIGTTSTNAIEAEVGAKLTYGGLFSTTSFIYQRYISGSTTSRGATDEFKGFTLMFGYAY
jgi:hypothetical protein